MAKRAHSALATAAVSALFLAFPASAASAATGAAISKTEAIIGAPSRLAQILAEQGAPVRPAALTMASYAVSRPAILSLQPRFAPAPKPAPKKDSAVSSGRPDVFGSVALKVDHTPLDNRWRRVERSRVSGAAAKFAASLRDSDAEARIDAVNRYVNSRIRFVDDSRQYRRADVWATANETFRRGRGDCEDYAIAKIQMLRAAGVADRDLYLVVLKDLVRRSDHAVAVVRSGGRMYVLDNGTDRLLESSEVSDYRPILTFASSGAWTHGYRVTRPATVIASADPVVPAPLRPVDGGDQRSRSASLLALSTGFSK